MKNASLKLIAWSIAAVLVGSGLDIVLAYAEDTTPTSTSTNSADTSNMSEADAAADAAAGLPKFKNRQERRQYLKKLRQDDPAKFKALKEQWAKNHPKAAKRMQQRKEWRQERRENGGFNPGQGGPGRDGENRWGGNRDQGRWDRREDRWNANHGSDSPQPTSSPSASPTTTTTTS